MKPIVEKVLRSGIIDRGLAELLERWGNLPAGASEIIGSQELKDATKEQLTKFANELAETVANEHILKETQLDLDQMRWPTKVVIKDAYPEGGRPGPERSIGDLQAMIDRMGRLYFRIQEVNPDWFVPGYHIFRRVHNLEITERILDAQTLFVGDQPIAIQVTVAPIED